MIPASSWIQQKIFTADSEVFEPLSRTTSGQSTLAELFFCDGGYMLSPFDNNEENINNEIEYILSRRPAEKKVFVLSHERLSGNPNSGGFDLGPNSGNSVQCDDHGQGCL